MSSSAICTACSGLSWLRIMLSNSFSLSVIESSLSFVKYVKPKHTFVKYILPYVYPFVNPTFEGVGLIIRQISRVCKIQLCIICTQLYPIKVQKCTHKIHFHTAKGKQLCGSKESSRRSRDRTSHPKPCPNGRTSPLTPLSAS